MPRPLPGMGRAIRFRLLPLPLTITIGMGWQSLGSNQFQQVDKRQVLLDDRRNGSAVPKQRRRTFHYTDLMDIEMLCVFLMGRIRLIPPKNYPSHECRATRLTSYGAN